MPGIRRRDTSTTSPWDSILHKLKLPVFVLLVFALRTVFIQYVSDADVQPTDSPAVAAILTNRNLSRPERTTIITPRPAVKSSEQGSAPAKATSIPPPSSGSVASAWIVVGLAIA